MAEVFFVHLTTPYFYDTKQSKLFQIARNSLKEISDAKIQQNIRFNSVEIGREQAFFLAQKFSD